MLKTRIHAYCFDVSNPEQRLAHQELSQRLRAQGLEPFTTWSGGGGHYDFVRDLSGQEIGLETAHLFDNQWNTGPIPGHSEQGLRVFDWAEDYTNARPVGSMAPKNIRRGHYLEQTAEMREVRRNTVKCGYCGKQEPAAKGYVFCPHCLGSEYLKPDDIERGTTRMVPIDRSGPGRACKPLSDAERAHVVPLYREAQIDASKIRNAAHSANSRARVVNEAEGSIKAAETKRDGMLWLLDRGFHVDNVIFYSHTGRFCIGWRTPVSDAVRDALLEVMSEFPFAYDLKTADGRTLSAG